MNLLLIDSTCRSFLGGGLETRASAQASSSPITGRSSVISDQAATTEGGLNTWFASDENGDAGSVLLDFAVHPVSVRGGDTPGAAAGSIANRGHARADGFNRPVYWEHEVY